MAARRPLGYVELDKEGNEITDFGKGRADQIMNAKKLSAAEAKEAEELKKLFGEKKAQEFIESMKGAENKSKEEKREEGALHDGTRNGIPLNEAGEYIDNKKITITTIKTPGSA